MTAKPVDPLWMPRSDCAELCGLSVRQFGDVIQPDLGPDAKRGSGPSLRLYAPAVVKALLTYRMVGAKGKPADDETDPLLKGDESPALERYRLGRAKMVEMDLAERERQTVRVQALRDAMRGGVSALRSTGDRLVRQFGNEAGEMFNEGVADFEAAALRAIGGE